MLSNSSASPSILLTLANYWTEARPGYKGILLMILASFAFSCMDTIAKMMSSHYDPFQVVWARYCSQSFWSLVVLAPFLTRLLKTRYLKLQILRSGLLFGATLAFFSALPYLKLAELFAIFEVAPLLITCLSFLVLKEKVSWPRWVGVTIGLLGALIIIRPGTEVFTPYALLPVVAASCFAGYSITTRFLGSEESPWTNFLYTALIGTFIASVLVIPKWQPIAMEDLPVLASFGMIGGIGHLMLIFALRYTQASILAPFSYFGLLYSSFWGFFVFEELPDIFTYLGAFVIVASGVFVWYRENRKTVVAVMQKD